MKKILPFFLILIVTSIAIFFFFAGKIVDKNMNICLHIDDIDYNIGPNALALHNTLNIADLHSDLLLWDRSITERGSSGHTDIPRLIEGNFTLQVFDAVIKTPKGQNYESNTAETDNITLLTMSNRWPIRTWNSLFERAIYQSEKLYEAERKLDGQLQIITNQNELKTLLTERKNDKNIVGGLLSIEGLHALEGDIKNLSKLYNAGYRMMGPVHFFDNKVGGSSAGKDQYGLTEFGKKVIAEMEEREIIIDLAHASSALIDDVLNMATRPIVVSHTGVKGTYESPRNLSDQQLKLIAANGGMIGIGFWDGAVGSPDLENIVKAMRYTVDLIGIDHIALGSDWDGGTTTYFDAAHISVLTEAMMNNGFSNEEIRKIMGDNQIQFFLQNLPKI